MSVPGSSDTPGAEDLGSDVNVASGAGVCDAHGSPESNCLHGGHVRTYLIQVYTQPPGHGSFTLATTVELCGTHRMWFEGAPVNLGIGKPLKVARRTPEPEASE